MPPRSDDNAWAVTEFAEAELGEARRTQRLIALATVLAQRPGAPLPAACSNDALLKAAYRFFDHAAIEPQDLLDSHLSATFLRLAAVLLVLAVQDTTELDWTAHPAPTGLGPLGHSTHRGLCVHTTLAFTPERVPLADQTPRQRTRVPFTDGYQDCPADRVRPSTGATPPTPINTCRHRRPLG